MDIIQQVDRSIIKQTRRSWFNIIHAMLSVVLIAPMIYYSYRVWSSRYCPSAATDEMVKNKKLIFGLAISNVILSFGPILYTIGVKDILGTTSLLSTYFFTLSVIILLWSWRLYTGNTEWCLQEFYWASLFILFSLLLQFVGYIVTIVTMFRQDAYYLSVLKESRQILRKRKSRRKNSKL